MRLTDNSTRPARPQTRLALALIPEDMRYPRKDEANSPVPNKLRDPFKFKVTCSQDFSQKDEKPIPNFKFSLSIIIQMILIKNKLEDFQALKA